MPFNNWARMIHPPRHIRAHNPKSTSHPSLSLAALMIDNPWAYDATFEQYNAACKSLTIWSLSTEITLSVLGPFRIFSAAIRSSFRPDMYRESNADAMVGAATLCSAASWTVHRPVPFIPVLSRM